MKIRKYPSHLPLKIINYNEFLLTSGLQSLTWVGRQTVSVAFTQERWYLVSHFSQWMSSYSVVQDRSRAFFLSNLSNLSSKSRSNHPNPPCIKVTQDKRQRTIEVDFILDEIWRSFSNQRSRVNEKKIEIKMTKD